jgi:hypothetical protein
MKENDRGLRPIRWILLIRFYFCLLRRGSSALSSLSVNLLHSLLTSLTLGPAMLMTMLYE